MENHRRIWHRFVLRLRSSRRTYNYAPRSTVESRNVSSLSRAVDASFSGRYSRLIRDNVRIRPRLPLACQSNWNIANSFGRPYRFDKLVSFTPKCLTGFNAQPILSGQISYDDFSHNCWLENHLHRFGGLQTDAVSCEDSNNLANNENDAQLSPENESVASYTQNDVAVPNSIRSSSNTNNGNTYSSSTGSHISSCSTVSDVTHFYLAGFAFGSDSVFPEPPPPYSELHDDPPPPYTEIPDPIISRSRNTRSASNQVINSHDILW